jgi:hypothetical protein
MDLKHGESSVNLMSMTLKKHRIVMRRDGWRNKIKKAEKNMKKKSVKD